MKLISFFLFFAIFTICWGAELSEGKFKVLYNSLEPNSISQHLAFYELYPNHELGQQALKDALVLLTGSTQNQNLFPNNVFLSGKVINAIVGLVNKPLDKEFILSDPNTIESLSKLSTRLHHNRLKGHQVWSEQEVLSLPIEEIDLARGLFLSQFGPDKCRIQSYEALIDLMALQILARLPKDCSPEEKIKAINSFIFDEMGFRFPPHSIHAKEIDIYTFLPSVLDSRRGVCLGVSILYMCIAQRLALSLEMITPPGHIYVRYHAGDKMINIETTARGIHIDSKEYLSVNTCSLQERNILEVIGMVHFNQASVHWQNQEYDKALIAYQKAEPYMKEDPLLKELMGYAFLLNDYKVEGEKNLKEIQHYIPDYAIVKNTMVDDYFHGNVDINGISAMFSKCEEDRNSLLAKKELLEKVLEKYPRFQAGYVTLAGTWLQLHRTKEALEILSKYQSLNNDDPEVNYYLSVLYAQRHDFPKAWFHLKQAEHIVHEHEYYPKILKELRRELLSYCPE